MPFASTICFMCLSEHSSSNTIELHKIDHELIQQITFVIPEIPVCKSNSPHYICTICKDKLKYFNNFKKMCRMNYNRWTYYMHKFDKLPTQPLSSLNVVLHTPNMKRKNEDKEVSSTDEEDFMEIEKELGELNKKLCRSVGNKQKIIITSPDSPKPSTSSQQNGVHVPKPITPDSSDPTAENENDTEAEKRYPCKTCERDFSSNTLLLDHISFKHKGIKRHKCHSCDMLFSTGSHMQFHCNKFHYGERLFRCQFCPTVFTLRQDLMTHLCLEHKEGRKIKIEPNPDDMGKKRWPRPVQCDMCKRRFMNKAAYISHRKTHFLGKPDPGQTEQTVEENK